jgi:hypothetical protein
MSLPEFRKIVPPPGKSGIAGPDAKSHTEVRIKNPRAQELIGTWRALYEKPFSGITSDGKVVPGLFSLAPNGAPIKPIVAAATNLLSRLTSAQRAAVCFPLDAPEWRRWQNTELQLEADGIRLDQVDASIRDTIMAVVQESLSPQGFEKIRNVMKLNRFLGDLVDGPGVMGEWSFTFSLFAKPSLTEPWGWQLFGHHLALNCLVIGEQMVISPTFLGAEPFYADAGPFKGIRLFREEEELGLALMRSLSPAQQAQATIFHSMKGGDIPPERVHFADERHFGGAFRDNRIVPYEGIKISEFSRDQKKCLLDLIEVFLILLPPGPRKARIEDIVAHLDETRFCWIGGHGESSTFYYRVQSPVVLIEFDHHCGVFLTNENPEKFHVHTIVRTPNGNDYGNALLDLYYARSSKDRSRPKE